MHCALSCYRQNPHTHFVTRWRLHELFNLKQIQLQSVRFRMLQTLIHPNLSKKACEGAFPFITPAHTSCAICAMLREKALPIHGPYILRQLVTQQYGREPSQQSKIEISKELISRSLCTNFLDFWAIKGRATLVQCLRLIVTLCRMYAISCALAYVY